MTQLPGFRAPIAELAEAGPWRITTRLDPAVLALADRHYSRRHPGKGQVGPPGRKVVLVTPCERAAWLSHWPKSGLAYDGLDAWRCTLFRNEGAGLSSELIVEAMRLTAAYWHGEEPPADGWLTWVDTRKVRSSNPGYCFLRAGWRRDDEWNPARGRRGRLRFRADLLKGYQTPSS